MKKRIQILFIGALFVALASCEKEEALERVDETVEVSESGNSITSRSAAGENSGSTNSGGPGITDPGNDDDYDKEDPATTNSSSNN